MAGTANPAVKALMRILAVGNNNQAGLTLVELLVVLAVMAVLTGVVVLSLPPAPGPSQRIAQEVAALTKRLGDRAIMEGRPMGLYVTGEGWQPALFADGAWQMLPARPLDEDDSLRLDLALEDQVVLPEEEEAAAIILARRTSSEEEAPPPPPPDIVFDPVGEVTPFRLTVTGPKANWRVITDPFGKVEVRRGER